MGGIEFGGGEGAEGAMERGVVVVVIIVIGVVASIDRFQNSPLDTLGSIATDATNDNAQQWVFVPGIAVAKMDEAAPAVGGGVGVEGGTAEDDFFFGGGSRRRFVDLDLGGHNIILYLYCFVLLINTILLEIISRIIFPDGFYRINGLWLNTKLGSLSLISHGSVSCCCRRCCCGFALGCRPGPGCRLPSM